jgi:hypothetical protein
VSLFSKVSVFTVPVVTVGFGYSGFEESDQLLRLLISIDQVMRSIDTISQVVQDKVFPD